MAIHYDKNFLLEYFHYTDIFVTGTGSGLFLKLYLEYKKSAQEVLLVQSYLKIHLCIKKEIP